MTARHDPHNRYPGESQICDRPSGDDEPDIIIASIHRSRTLIGPNTHTGHFEKVLQAAGLRFRIITPLSRFKPFVALILALRRLVDLASPPAGVWWFLHFRTLFLRLWLARELRHGQRAVVYARCPNSAQAALAARRNSGQKIVMAVHFNQSEAEEWLYAGKLGKGDWAYRRIQNREAEVLPRVDGIHFISRFMRDYIYQHHPEASKCRSLILPNFIKDPASVAVHEPKGDLISIGTLEPRKNQAYLIRVLHAARLLGHRYSLTLVGQGPDRRRLQGLARDLAVLDQVHFLGSRANAARLLPTYRAYVHAALIENFPFALIEAQAYGLPVLAGPVGGVAEVFLDGQQGFYWPLDDPAEGARKLILLLEDEATHARLAQGARRRFEQCYNADLVGPRLIEFLLEVAEERPDPVTNQRALPRRHRRVAPRSARHRHLGV